MKTIRQLLEAFFLLEAKSDYWDHYGEDITRMLRDHVGNYGFNSAGDRAFFVGADNKFVDKPDYRGLFEKYATDYPNPYSSRPVHGGKYRRWFAHQMVHNNLHYTYFHKLHPMLHVFHQYEHKIKKHLAANPGATFPHYHLNQNSDMEISQLPLSHDPMAYHWSHMDDASDELLRRIHDPEADHHVIHDEHWTHYIPKTLAASIKIGQVKGAPGGAYWCTSKHGHKAAGFWEDYTRSGHNIVSIPKKPMYEGEKYQTHVPTTTNSKEAQNFQFKSEDNKDANMRHVMGYARPAPNLLNHIKTQVENTMKANHGQMTDQQKEMYFHHLPNYENI